MCSDIITAYEKVLPGELAASNDKESIIKFLKSIEGKEIELIFTLNDAFEKQDDNVWLPESLWEKI